MAIAYDNSTTGGAQSNTTSFSYSHTVNDNTNGILFVGVFTDSTTDNITGVTYNGVAMTLLSSIYNGVDEWNYLYYLVAPAVGTHDVVVSASPSTPISSLAASYTGASQTGVPDSSGTNAPGTNVTTQTVSTTVVAANSWVIGISQNDARSQVASTGVTERTWQPSVQHFLSLGDSNGPQSAGSYSMTWNTASGSGRFTQIAASFAPAGGSSVSKLTLLGVG